jgi:osmotically-inducible protein OsmY
MTRLTRSISVLAAVTLALTGCATVHDPIVQFYNDSSTTAAIKTRLALDRPGSITAIGVDTTDDMVRLTGTVASEAERRQVEAVARDVAGDNRVINELRVAGSAPAPRAQTR